MILFACKSSKETRAIEEVEPDFVRVSLKKGPCFGQCPVYELKIYNSQMAVFKGKRFTEKLGTYSKQLSNEEYNQILMVCKSAELPSMQAKYLSQIADLPLITIGYAEDADSYRTIQGKESRPEKLLSVQKQLEIIAESDGWTLEEAANLDEPKTPVVEEDPEIVKTEIIIQPAEGIRLPMWIKKHKERYGLRLLDRISEEKNYWLITWDQSKATPDEFLNALHRDKEIALAQYNLKVEGR